MRAALLLAFACGFGCAAVHASGSSPAAASRCEFGALVTETDRAGLNVRQGPSVTAKVLGTLPPVYRNPSLNGYRVKVEVDVVAAQAGWMQIDNAKDNEALTEKPARPMYPGKGWVSGRKLSVKSQAGRGHALPDSRSPVVLSLAEHEAFDADLWVDAGQLLGCSGRWALVEFDSARLPKDVLASLKISNAARAGLPKGRFRAWLNQICGIQETSCSGLVGEEVEQPAPR